MRITSIVLKILLFRVTFLELEWNLESRIKHGSLANLIRNKGANTNDLNAFILAIWKAAVIIFNKIQRTKRRTSYYKTCWWCCLCKQGANQYILQLRLHCQLHCSLSTPWASNDWYKRPLMIWKVCKLLNHFIKFVICWSFMRSCWESKKIFSKRRTWFCLNRWLLSLLLLILKRYYLKETYFSVEWWILQSVLERWKSFIRRYFLICFYEL